MEMSVPGKFLSTLEYLIKGGLIKIMRLNKDYLDTNTEKIKSTFYAECIEDLEFQFNFNMIKCYKTIIYKFSKKNNELYLVKEFAKVDVDRSIIFEEIEIPIKKFYNKFKLVGNLYSLIDWIEK